MVVLTPRRLPVAHIRHGCPRRRSTGWVTHQPCALTGHGGGPASETRRGSRQPRRNRVGAGLRAGIAAGFGRRRRARVGRCLGCGRERVGPGTASGGSGRVVRRRRRRPPLVELPEPQATAKGDERGRGERSDEEAGADAEGHAETRLLARRWRKVDQWLMVGAGVLLAWCRACAPASPLLVALLLPTAVACFPPLALRGHQRHAGAPGPALLHLDGRGGGGRLVGHPGPGCGQSCLLPVLIRAQEPGSAGSAATGLRARTRRRRAAGAGRGGRSTARITIRDVRSLELEGLGRRHLYASPPI